MIAVWKTVILLCGKAKKANDAEVVDNGSVTAPQQAASNDEEPLVFELAEPVLGAPSTSFFGSSPH